MSDMRYSTLKGAGGSGTVTEKYAEHPFQAPCCCFENGLAMDFLFVESINVSID